MEGNTVMFTAHFKDCGNQLLTNWKVAAEQSNHAEESRSLKLATP